MNLLQSELTLSSDNIFVEYCLFRASIQRDFNKNRDNDQRLVTSPNSFIANSSVFLPAQFILREKMTPSSFQVLVIIEQNQSELLSLN